MSLLTELNIFLFAYYKYVAPGGARTGAIFCEINLAALSGGEVGSAP
jgi:hypothetical protein